VSSFSRGENIGRDLRQRLEHAGGHLNGEMYCSHIDDRRVCLRGYTAHSRFREYTTTRWWARTRERESERVCERATRLDESVRAGAAFDEALTGATYAAR
jgi:hypothetical protein